MDNAKKDQARKLKTIDDVVLIKKCHVCGTVVETSKELKKCHKCKKSFLPSNYFNKVHAKDTEEFEEMFLSSSELEEDILVKGIHVLW